MCPPVIPGQGWADFLSLYGPKTQISAEKRNYNISKTTFELGSSINESALAPTLPRLHALICH